MYVNIKKLEFDFLHFSHIYTIWQVSEQSDHIIIKWSVLEEEEELVSSSNYSIFYINHDLAAWFFHGNLWCNFNALFLIEKKCVIKVRYRFPWKMMINEPFLQVIAEIFSAITWHKVTSRFLFFCKTQTMTFNFKANWGYDKVMTSESPTVTTLTI